MRVEGERGEETDLNVELECLPGFDGDSVELVWYAYGLTGPSTEYGRDGRLE